MKELRQNLNLRIFNARTRSRGYYDDKDLMESFETVLYASDISLAGNLTIWHEGEVLGQLVFNHVDERVRYTQENEIPSYPYIDKNIISH